MDSRSIRPGQDIPSLEVDISRADLVRYAGASGDYFFVHWDQDRTRALGYPDVVVHGWLSLGHMLRAVQEWLPPERAEITNFTARYCEPTYPGVITYRGTVTEVTKNGEATLITVQLTASDTRSEVKTRATAVLRMIA